MRDSWWVLQALTEGKLRQAPTESRGQGEQAGEGGHGTATCDNAPTEPRAKQGTGIPFAFLIFVYHFASKKIPFPEDFNDQQNAVDLRIVLEDTDRQYMGI